MKSFLILALFESIENNQVETLRTILKTDAGVIHINTLNNDELSPLDIAVLLDNHAIIKVLLQFGADSGMETVENIENHLNTLLLGSEQKLYVISSKTTPSTSSGPESDRERSFYEKRIKLLRKMLVGWQNLRIPDSPFSFSIGLCEIKYEQLFGSNVAQFTDVVGNNSVLIKILQPIENFICTKVKGEKFLKNC